MDLAYAYANARVKAMQSKLLPASKLRELMEVKSIPEMVELLEATHYKESFVWASTKYSGLELITRALSLDFAQTLKKLMRIVPKKGLQKLSILLRDFELQNVGVVISSKATGVPFSDTDLVVIDEKSRARLQKLHAKESVEVIIKELRTEPYGPALQKALLEYEKEKDFRVFLRALSAFHHSQLSELARKEKNILLKNLVAAKMRDANLLILLRVKKSSAELDALPYMTAPDAILRELNSMKDYAAILEKVKVRFRHHAAAVDESTEKKSLIPLELSFERELTRKTLRSLHMSILDFGAVLSYLYLKQEELGTIRKIAYAKHFGFGDELKELIFLQV